jgi:hypothetical protein
MTYPSVLVHPTVGVVNFLRAEFPDGWPVDIPTPAEERLESPGVDGVRFGTLQLQEQTVQMSTSVDCSDYLTAITVAQTHRKVMDGQPVTLTVSFGSSSIIYRNVHVISVQAVPTAGPLIGGEASPGTQASVETVWQLELMDTTTPGETG